MLGVGADDDERGAVADPGVGVLAGVEGVVLEGDFGIFHDAFLTGRIALDVEFHETARGTLGHLIIIFAAGDALQGIVFRDIDALAGEDDLGLVGGQVGNAAYIGAVLVLGHAAVLDGADEEVKIVIFVHDDRFRLRFRFGFTAADCH